MESLNRTRKPQLLSTLQEELIVDILCRLSVKSLLRFRCLSKFFLSIIDGQDFVKLHLKRSIETDSNLSLIYFGHISLSDNMIFSGSLDSVDHCVEVDHPFKNCRRIQTGMGDPRVIGSCNGLVALHNREKGIVLMNPLTKKHRLLPKFYSDLKDCNDYFDGFGYDASTDDLKLVRIVVFNNHLPTEVTVYRLKTNTWRRIEDFPFYFFMNAGNGALASGALHWVGNLNPEATEDDLIIAFDLKTEEFYQVPMPPAGDGGYFIAVEVLRGCLSVVCMYDNWGPCNIWVMKEYGVKDSWNKLFSFQEESIIMPGCYVAALAYSNSGDKVLVKHYGGFYWCNLETQTVERVDIDDKVLGYDAIICVDSLVSPNTVTTVDC